MTDLEKAKELLVDYICSEFQRGEDEAYEGIEEKPTEIGIAYTTISDYEIDIQVYADIVNCKIVKYLGVDEEFVAEEIEFENLAEMNCWMERNLFFDWLVDVPKNSIKEFLQTEEGLSYK